MQFGKTPLLSQGYFPQAHPRRAITALLFDAVESILWTGSREGFLEGWLVSAPPPPPAGQEEEEEPGQPLTQYVRVPLHVSPIIQLAVGELGIYSLGKAGLCYTSRRGVPIFRTSIPEARTFWLGGVSFGGHGGATCVYVTAGSTVHQVNAYTGTPMRTLQLEFEPTMAKVLEGGRIGLADTQGHIHLLDLHPRRHGPGPGGRGGAAGGGGPGLHPTTSIKAHIGLIVDFDVQNSVLAVVGASPAGAKRVAPTGHPHHPTAAAAHAALPDKPAQAEPLVRLFDLRTGKGMMPISFSRPVTCTFHPHFPGILCIVSATGLVQFTDIHSPTQVTFVPVPVSKEVACTAFSSTGHFLALGDALGCLHGLAGQPAPCVNLYSRPSEYLSWANPSFRPLDQRPPPLGWEEPLNAVGMPHYSEELLLSAQFPKTLSHSRGLEGPKLDPALLQQAKTIDFIGYCPNPKTRPRNTDLYFSQRKHTAGPKFRSEQQQQQLLQQNRRSRSATSGPVSGGAMRGSEEGTFPAGGGVSGRSSTADLPAARRGSRTSHSDPYQRLEIKYSRFGIEDFDFGYYNHTRYSGLETHIQNSYVNPFLQLLHFTTPLRAYAKHHIQCDCPIEFCMLCEFGFLARMLEDGHGQNCQAHNFLRSFRMLPNAKSLGLLDPETGLLSYAPLLQSFNRFILEQFSKESAGDAFVQELFAPRMETVSRCMACGAQQRHAHTPFVFELGRKPSTLLGGPSASASAVGGAGRQGSSMSTTAGSAPSFVAELAASFARESSSRAWCDACKQYHQTTSRRHVVSGLPPVLQVNVHPDLLQLPGVPTGNAASSGTRRMGQWIPHVLDLGLSPDGLLIPGADAHYRLTATISEVRQEKGHHLVAHILVDSKGMIPSPIGEGADVADAEAGMEDGVVESASTWYLFNDFLVQPIPKTRVTEVSEAMRPVILQYSRVPLDPDAAAASLEEESTRTRTPPKPLAQPTWRKRKIPDPYVMFRPSFLNKRKDVRVNFVPLAPSEIPVLPGTVLALDAEFVALSKEEVEVGSDGKRSVVRPPRRGLARLSVLRESGVPLIDDYVVNSEPVVDYLTEFSGIHPGDLDLVGSQRPLMLPKHVYKKLRFLIDCGCLFIGHGLKSDFRIMNVLVPPAQVMDTVDLYFMPSRQRRLSLKFLLWAVKRVGIQRDIRGHDSIEDALAALDLYKVYLDRTREGTFHRLLEEVYAIGDRVHFRVPEGLPAT